jgi:hypothetical protein
MKAQHNWFCYLVMLLFTFLCVGCGTSVKYVHSSPSLEGSETSTQYNQEKTLNNNADGVYVGDLKTKKKHHHKKYSVVVFSTASVATPAPLGSKQVTPVPLITEQFSPALSNALSPVLRSIPFWVVWSILTLVFIGIAYFFMNGKVNHFKARRSTQSISGPKITIVAKKTAKYKTGIILNLESPLVIIVLIFTGIIFFVLMNSFHSLNATVPAGDCETCCEKGGFKIISFVLMASSLVFFSFGFSKMPIPNKQRYPKIYGFCNELKQLCRDFGIFYFLSAGVVLLIFMCFVPESHNCYLFKPCSYALGFQGGKSFWDKFFG